MVTKKISGHNGLLHKKMPTHEQTPSL